MTTLSRDRASARRAAAAQVTVGQDGLAAACAAAVLAAVRPSGPGDGVELDPAGPAGRAGAVLASIRALRHAGLVEVSTTPDHTLRLRTAAAGEAVLYALAEHARRVSRWSERWDWRDHEAVTAASGRIRRDAEALADRLATTAGVSTAMLRRARAHLDGVHDTIVLPRLRPVPATGTDAGGPVVPEGTNQRFLSTYGLAGSYAEALLAVVADPLAAHTPDSVNAAVDRTLNIAASGAAHRPYFLAARAAIRRVFDHPDFDSQPSVIVDTGCGDGTWLRDIHRFVRDRTFRGQVLDRYPLHLVGVDLSPVAVEVAGRALGPIGGHAILGDIGAPERIVEQVERQTGAGAARQLHIRAFIDHNRALQVPPPSATIPSINGPFGLTAQGAYVSAAQVVHDWIDHLERWRHVLHGDSQIIVIEAHTPTKPTPAGFGFEFYHTLSGQSPLPWTDFSAAVPISGARFVDPPQIVTRNGFAAVSVSRIAGPASVPAAEGGRRAV